MYIKVRKFQNKFVKLSFLPKYKPIIVRISALCSEGKNLTRPLPLRIFRPSYGPRA